MQRILFAVVAVVSFLKLINACNEAVCASIVSKCTLLRSCECKIVAGEECKCCDRCSKCLDYAMAECCSCFGLCPKPDVTQLISHQSTVFDFPRPTPELWEALTGGESNSHLDQWDRVTFPVDIAPSLVTGKALVKLKEENAKKSSNKEFIGNSDEKPLADDDVSLLTKKEDLITVNCTVIYLRECISASKCKNHCSTMGSTSGRWFEDGCCQCIGHNCGAGLYGIDESRCEACGQEDDDNDLEELSDEELLQLEQEFEKELYSEEDLK